MKLPASLLCLAGSLAIGAATASQPNIVFILADDMAWHGTDTQMEPGFRRSAGKTRRTPHINRLAKTGMVFSRAFSAASICAPSRCSIQTGMSAARTKFSGNGNFGTTSRQVTYNGRRNKGQLMLEPSPIGSIDPEAITVAEHLKGLGYATAHVGKWHIYGGGPGRHGYDQHDGETSNADGNSKDPADPKKMFSMTRKAIDFIEAQLTAKKPFFVQVSHYAEHNAVQYIEETYQACLRDPNIARITPIALRRRVAQRSAMVEDMDRSIGQLLEKLDQLGIREKTYIIFTSDNGHYRDTGEERLLRGDKWWLWEGGIRVPMIVSGPGVKPESNCDTNVVGYDFLPTFVELAGGQPAQLKDVDGLSLKPLFGGTFPTRFAKRSLHFHYPHHRNTTLHSAVIRGNHKLLRFWERPGSMYLYDLENDIRESANVATGYPSVAQELNREMDRHFAAVNASLPKPNPNADPSYHPYDPDASKAAGQVQTRNTKKPKDKAAKKRERQMRRDAKKKARNR